MWKNMMNGMEAAVIKVIGVGDAGSNAVEYMVEKKIVDVEFFCINTDRHALKKSKVETLLQIGEDVTIGDVKEIVALVDGADIVFIIAGLGADAKAGAALVIAKIANDMGMLVVAVVIKPCLTESRQIQIVAEGLDELLKYVDTIITIPIEKAVEAQGDAVTNVDTHSICNDVVYNAVSSITDLINYQGVVGIDFADVRTVLSEMGLGRMAATLAIGPDRARIAAEQAVASLLLEDVNLANARSVLVNITSSSSFRMKEYYDVMNTIKEFTADDAMMIVGSVLDESMGDNMRVTIMATFGTIESSNIHTADG